MKYHIELQSKGKSHWWRVVSRNGKTMLTSETYGRPSTRTRVASGFSKSTGIAIKNGAR